MKHTGYFTRALKAKDRRYARVFDRMGYERTDLGADNQPAPSDLGLLREQYLAVVGKRAYHGWSADELREKIAAADQERA